MRFVRKETMALSVLGRRRVAYHGREVGVENEKPARIPKNGEVPPAILCPSILKKGGKLV
jgi:hypothetical protein